MYYYNIYSLLICIFIAVPSTLALHYQESRTYLLKPYTLGTAARRRKMFMIVPCIEIG